MKQSLLISMVPMMVLGGTSVSLAQEQPVAKGSLALEEIVVRARRVEESGQDVPLAITAFTGEQLEKAGVKTISDLSKTVPSVKVSQAVGRKQAAFFAIRGQRADDVLLTQDQAVGVYINGVAQGWPYGVGQAGILDIESFEVAKGPQGTLFGKNTTGGAIIITPNAPTDKFEASVSAGYGNYDAITTEGMINVPISETLAARVAASYSRMDGPFKNPDVGADFGGDKTKAVRVSLQWKPTDALSSLLVFDGFDSDTNSGVAAKLTAVNPVNPVDLAIGGRLGLPGFNAYATSYAAAFAQQRQEGFFSAHTDEDQFMKTRTWGFSNVTAWDASSNLTIKNIASVSRLEVDGLADLDGVNRNAFPLQGSFPVGYPVIGGFPYAAVLSSQFSTRQITEGRQITEELQLIGDTDPVDWIAGVYYSQLKGRDYSFSNQFSAVQTISGPAGGLTNESVAAFAQTTFHLTNTVNLTTGLRYTRDQREIIATARSTVPSATSCSLTDPAYVSATNPTGKLPAGQCEIKADDSFGEPSWNVSLDWKVTPDSLLYLAHRRGYRSGAFSGRGTSRAALVAAKPETVDDIELGSKSDFNIAGQPLRLNAAVFYQDYKDVQRNLTAVLNGLLQNTVVNAASATIKGGEVELTYLPFDSLELQASYAYVDAQYDKWDAPNPATGVVVDRSANAFAVVPKNSGSFTARYRLPMPEQIGTLNISGNVYAQSKIALYVDNAVDGSGNTCQGSAQGGYTLYNARIDWDNLMGSRGLSAAVWGKNLTDKEYLTSGLCLYNQTGFSIGYPGEPRTYGLTVSYKFGQ